MARDNSQTDPTESGVKRNWSEMSFEAEQPKRLKNVSTACDQCKKRKIKCNGESPCRRCRNMQLSCTYVPNSAMQSLAQSSDFKKLNNEVSVLQRQVTELTDKIASMSSVQQRLDLLEGRIESDIPGRRDSAGPSTRSFSDDTQPNCPALPSAGFPWPQLPQSPRVERRKYRGPTTSSYDVDVAKSSLCRMGIDSVVEDEIVIEEEEDPTIEGHAQQPLPDRLWDLSRAEALEAAQIYEEECGVMYPLFDISTVFRRLEQLFVDGSKDKVPLLQTSAEEENEINQIRLVLAIGYLLKGDGHETTAKRLYAYMAPVLSLQLLRPPNLDSLIILILTATYLFHTDDEGAAWRLIGIAARSCYEMGLHRKEALHAFADPDTAALAIRLFWIVYALDRRWSFGTGMPFAIQDADVDGDLPEPAEDNIYLKHITRCNTIMSKIWSFNLEFHSNNLGKEDDIGFLEYQVRQWYEELPLDLKLTNDQLEETTSRKLYKLRVMLRLRANLAIIHVYRPILHSATNIHRHLVLAKKAVDVARDTITLLISVNQVSSIYRDQQVLYNYFLVQALAVIFLAISHAPAEFLSYTRKDFFEALDLVKGFTMKSQASQRLWHTVQELKRLRDQIRCLDTKRPLGPNVVIRADSQFPSQPPVSVLQQPHKASRHSTAVHLPSTATIALQQQQQLTPMNGSTMSNDLLALFEGLGNVPFSPFAGEGAVLDMQPNMAQESSAAVSDSTPANPELQGMNGTPFMAHANSSSHLDATPPVYRNRNDDHFSNIWTELL